MTNHLLYSAGRVRAEPATAADGGTAVVLGSVVPSEVGGGAAPAAERERWAKYPRAMKYHATDIEVQLGDRVTYRHLFIGKSSGVVAYLPGVSKVNPRIIENQWVVRLENGKGVFMPHTEGLEFAHPRIVFTARGENDSEITPDETV